MVGVTPLVLVVFVMCLAQFCTSATYKVSFFDSFKRETEEQHRFSSGAIGSLLGAIKAWTKVSVNTQGPNEGRPKSRSMVRKQRKQRSTYV